MFGYSDDSSQNEESIEIVDLDSLHEQEEEAGIWNGEGTSKGQRVSDEQQREWVHCTRKRDDVRQPSSRFPLPLAPRFSLWQRYVQSGVTACLVGLVLFVLIFGNAATRSMLFSIVFPPTPKSEGPNFFYVLGSPRWGHLYIDGKLVAHPPNPAIQNSVPLSLPEGRHTLQWIAQPFLPQSCTFSEPPDSRHDSCLNHASTLVSNRAVAWVFVFPGNLTHLMPSLRQTLVSTIQSALNGMVQSTVILPGEAYAVDMISQYVLVAEAPFKATLHNQLDTDAGGEGLCSNSLALNAPCMYAGQDCYAICTTQFFSDEPAAWDVLVVVHTTWTYTTMSAQVVARGEPEIAGDVPLYEHLLPFRITWDGSHWHARPSSSLLPATMRPFFNPTCQAALDDERLDAPLRAVGSSHLKTSWQYVSGSNSAAGCLGIVTLNKGPNAPSGTSQPVAYCLFRFGVYSAVNALAHTYWPTMPVADAYEQHLAQQLATSPSYVEA